jgi:hypothetical protein
MRTASIALALLVLLALVALGSAGEEWGGGIEERRVPRIFVDYAYTLAILLFVGLAAVVVWAFTGPKGGVKVERPKGMGLVAFAFVVLVLLSWFALTDGGLLREGEQEVEPVGGRPGTPPDAPEGFAQAPAPEFQWWIAAAALLALAVIVWHERRRGKPAPPTAAQELEAVLSETLDELGAAFDADPRRAVIQAYARMERVLAAHGHGRRAHEAPLEYLARILRDLDVRPDAAHALTELFERAKFSRHEIDAAMRAEAVASLEAVRDDLRAAA